MPSSTFQNLPPAKRQRIFEAAVVEFAEYPFERSSVTRIVRRLGIAKGSIYQYFENKRDLYQYVVEEVYDEKRRCLQPVLDEPIGFFSRLQRYYQQSYLFAQANPLYHKVTVNLWETKDSSLQAFVDEIKTTRALDFTTLFHQAVQEGVVRDDLDEETAFFVYHSVGKELIEGFLDLPPSHTEDHLAFIESVLSALEKGVRKQEKQGGC